MFCLYGSSGPTPVPPNAPRSDVKRDSGGTPTRQRSAIGRKSDVGVPPERLGPANRENPPVARSDGDDARGDGGNCSASGAGGVVGGATVVDVSSVFGGTFFGGIASAGSANAATAASAVTARRRGRGQ